MLSVHTHSIFNTVCGSQQFHMRFSSMSVCRTVSVCHKLSQLNSFLNFEDLKKKEILSYSNNIVQSVYKTANVRPSMSEPKGQYQGISAALMSPLLLWTRKAVSSVGVHLCLNCVFTDVFFKFCIAPLVPSSIVRSM